MPRYAITDIHGCNRTFRALLDRLALGERDELFLLGDYIDRGPDSKGVIDTISELRLSPVTVHALRGNHEQMLIDSLYDRETYSVWLLSNGGLAALRSFGVKNLHALPEAYLAFFESLPHYHETPGYLLVHAGLNFHNDDPLDDRSALLWARNWYDDIDRDWLGDRIILHGHTPVARQTILEQLEKLDDVPALDLDSGCVYRQRSDMSHLCAFNLDTREIVFQKNVEDKD